MIYFKKVCFHHDDREKIETAFRKFAIKRHFLSQLEFSKSDIGTDKLFFGYESKNGLYFTRIKNSLEVVLPKIIFRMPKNETSFYYAFRLGTLATVLFFFLCFGIIFGLSQVIEGEISLESFMAPFMFFLLFLGLIWLEFRVTSHKINKAMMEQQIILNR